MEIVVTGGTGFIGGFLFESLLGTGNKIIALLRSGSVDPEVEVKHIKNFSADNDWASLLGGSDVVIHLAAKAGGGGSVDELQHANVDNTLDLAKGAASAGVRRFIFISSIKVNGESTTGRTPFSASDLLLPEDAYGKSKAQAESGLMLLSSETGMEVVIIRPPLVYGEGVKANFATLLKLADSALPLPFAGITNSRSMIYAGNLADFIKECVFNPLAANQTFLISDGRDVSLSELVQALRLALGRKIKTFNIPESFFRLIGTVLGKKETVERLVGSLQVDSSKVETLLSWTPPYSFDDGIKKTVDAYLNKQTK